MRGVGPCRRSPRRPKAGARIETFTVIYDREGAPSHGVVIARMHGGERVLARVVAGDEIARPDGYTANADRRARSDQAVGRRITMGVRLSPTAWSSPRQIHLSISRSHANFGGC